MIYNGNYNFYNQPFRWVCEITFLKMLGKIAFDERKVKFQINIRRIHFTIE